MLIVNLVVSKPGIYLHEIQVELIDALDIDVNLSTIGSFYLQINLPGKSYVILLYKGMLLQGSNIY